MTTPHELTNQTTKRIVQGGGKAKLDKRGHLQPDNPSPSGE
jgi:hypothetical protein